MAVRAVADQPDGFLGRWARRKTDVLHGKVVEEPAVITKPVLVEPVANDVKLTPVQSTEPPPELSLDDVKLLTKDSDFKPFMATNVGADVRNAAMKKLFADPHFNVMDGLDIYIDDYSKSDPIPEAMLRAMTSSKFLKLFNDEEEAEKNADAAAPRENANNTAAQTVAQSGSGESLAEPASVVPINSSQPELLPDGSDPVASQPRPASLHDNPHLRLQPDHAASAPEAGRGT